MKKKYLLFVLLSIMAQASAEKYCPQAPILCKKEGQYCMRWNGQIGWCRTIYDIKGNAKKSCEPFEVDDFGYPDRGYFWPGRYGDTDVLTL